ncbi:hypothetical protein F4778DRAFT_336411 [Xylariomycetidae sp. FL2044]|nr:hypothetical protein F4778DRAFT_336411 [Xylariomycetidae sp. FL2044]
MASPVSSPSPSSSSSTSSVGRLASIPSSMDPISTASTNEPPAVTRAATHAAALMPHIHSLAGGMAPERVPSLKPLETSTRTTQSPVPANTRRKRPAASAPEDSRWEVIHSRTASDLSRITDKPSGSRGRSSYRLTGSQNRRLSHDASQLPLHHIKGRQMRSPSRGRTRRRPTPLFDFKLRQSSSPDQRSISKSKNSENCDLKSYFQVTKHATVDQTPDLDELSLTEETENNADSEKDGLIRRGWFLLQKNRGLDEFRFPKPANQAQASWRAGDGFSEDEARPGHPFLVTGTHKRIRRSDTVIGMGQLQLRENDRSQEAVGVHSSIEHSIQCRSECLRNTAKEEWPTLANFAEIPERRGSGLASMKAHTTLASTILNDRPEPVSPREDMATSQSTGRGCFDFESFRRIEKGDTAVPQRSDVYLLTREAYSVLQSTPTSGLRTESDGDEGGDYEEGDESRDGEKDDKIPSIEDACESEEEPEHRVCSWLFNMNQNDNLEDGRR